MLATWHKRGHRSPAINALHAPGEVTWHRAREIAGSLIARGQSERILLGDADNRVLASDHNALLDLPSFDNSAMDGWAVHGDGPWTVAREVLAGHFPDWELAPGEACSIATGAPVPAGTTSIVRSEDGTLQGDQLTAPYAPGQDIRRMGEECRVGDLMVAQGTRLTPSAIGLLAATGHDQVQVQVQPTVHIVVFGDEIIFEGIPQRGKIRDSLGPQLPGWLDRMGAVIEQVTYCTDSLEEVLQTLSQVTADMVITTGGTAAGPRDFLRTVCEELQATMYVDGVHVRPGHPMMLATVPRRESTTDSPCPVIGLPGNPLSAIVGLLTLGEPLINSALGLAQPTVETLVSTSDLYAKSGTRLIAGNAHSGEFSVAEFNGSAMLRGLSHSTGFAVIDRDTPAGSTVQYLPLPRI